MLRQHLKSTGGHILLIAVFAIVAMLPAYYNGVPSGNDQSQHYQFASTVDASIESGVIYPPFAGDTNHGFGDYGIRFYPPLTYYALSAAYLVLQDWYFASLAAFTLVFFFGGVGIYLWAKEEFEPAQALIAALLYTFAPYHLNQIYNNALFAEFFATAIIPFCFLFLTRACRDAKWLDALSLAAAYSLLILTHLPMTVICSIAMGIYALLLLRKINAVQVLPKLLAAVLMAVAMTSFYWSRWLPEIDWITHSSQKYFATTWDYRTNFLLLPDHFLKFGEDALNLWFADVMLIATLLVSIPSIVYLARKRAARTKLIWATASILLFSVFMTTPLSSVIWDNLNFLQKVQFPWRWMAVISAFCAIFASIGIAKAAETIKAGNDILATIGIGAVLAMFFFTATFVTRGAVYVTRSDLNRQLNSISETEGCDCWWPIWARRSAFAQTEKIVAPGRNATVTSWSLTEKQIHVEPGLPSTATVKAFYYPRWLATVNGAIVPLEPSEDGTISVAVPAEMSDVHLKFREPQYIAFANIASVGSWLMVLVFTALLLVKSRRKVSQTAA